MIERVWQHIQPQMIEHIKDLRDHGYLLEEISEMVANKHNWTTTPAFEKYDFHYEHARFTMTQLCNLVELMEGSNAELKFCEGIRQRIEDLIEIQGIFEAEYPDQQRIMNAECEKEVEAMFV